MIKKEDIQSEKIITVENFIDSVTATELWQMAYSSPFVYGQRSDSRSTQLQERLVTQMDIEMFSGLDLWRQIQSTFHTPLNLKEAYINFANSATPHLPHCDGTGINDMTILITLNQNWDRRYGGYTYFFESMNSQKIIETVVPEPRKAVFFKGSIWHCASAPTILAPDPRFMLAIKTQFVEQENIS